jgi:transcriptional regulator with XRE-family HTH domain
VKPGEKLKAWRTRNGVSQVDFAEAIDLRQPVVSAWESGVRVPGLRPLFRVGHLNPSSPRIPGSVALLTRFLPVLLAP